MKVLSLRCRLAARSFKKFLRPAWTRKATRRTQSVSSKLNVANRQVTRPSIADEGQVLTLVQGRAAGADLPLWVRQVLRIDHNVMSLQLPDDRLFANPRDLAEAGARGYKSLIRGGSRPNFEVIRSDKK